MCDTDLYSVILSLNTTSEEFIKALDGFIEIQGHTSLLLYCRNAASLPLSTGRNAGIASGFRASLGAQNTSSNT